MRYTVLSQPYKDGEPNRDKTYGTLSEAFEHLDVERPGEVFDFKGLLDYGRSGAESVFLCFGGPNIMVYWCKTWAEADATWRRLEGRALPVVPQVSSVSDEETFDE